MRCWLVGLVFLSNESRAATKEFIFSRSGFPLAGRFGQKLFSQKRPWNVSEPLSLEHVMLERMWGRSLALRACPVGTAHHCQVSLGLPEAKKRGGFSAPAADLVHPPLSTAALAASTFHGVMAWLGFRAFFKFKTGNTQSKTCTCIFFDIHRKHSCLLPSAGDVGMREMI